MHPELHGHLWEAMHAKDALPVALDPKIEFYLSSRAPREYPLAQANTPTIANPSGTTGYEVGGFADGRQEAEDLDKIADELEPKDALPQDWRVQRTAGAPASGPAPNRAVECTILHICV